MTEDSAEKWDWGEPLPPGTPLPAEPAVDAVAVQIDPPAERKWYPPTPWDPMGLGVQWPESEEPPEIIPDKHMDPDGYARAMIAVRRKRHWNGETDWEPPKPNPHMQFDAPVFSSTVEVDPRPYLEPLDPRMGGWRLYDPDHAVAPERYLLRQGTAQEPLGIGVSVYRAPSGIYYKPFSTEILWENPHSGELRFCVARYYAPWREPWQSDNDRISREIQRRTSCICGYTEYAAMDLKVACYCELPGWSYYEEYWTEVTKPVDVPTPPRTLPAQHPMHTRWGRFRDRWWQLTHRREAQR